MGYFRKRQPRSSAKWNHSARHLLIRPALRSHVPGVPRCALPLHPPLQPPELTCLMFRVPSPIQQGASRLEATPRSSEGKHQSQQKPARQKQLSEFARQLRTRFLPLFPLICCYTHSAQDNVKFLKLRFPAYEKSGAGKRGPPGSYFKLGLRDVVGGWRGPRRSLANQEKGVGPGSRRGCLRED